ncbi:MAG TPA: hypothetical protein VF278_23790 [Pirellulales bacterium]
MGLDLLDVRFRLEKTFHIDIGNDEFLGLLRNQDILIGDLYEFILRKLQLRDSGRHSFRLNQFLWCEMNAALSRATETPPERIELGLPLKTLFPRDARRTTWQALRDACPYKVGDLNYPGYVRAGGFLLAAAVVLLEQRQLWRMVGFKWFLPILGLFGVWMVGETYLKMLTFLAPWRTSFPARMRTVKDLCRGVLSANYAEICRAADVALDEHCAKVWEQLVEVLVEALGVDAAAVTFRSRLIRDLDAQ